jgi:hypothetical protein
MLPSAAFIPPWAATVCERVGKSFVMTALITKNGFIDKNLVNV